MAFAGHVQNSEALQSALGYGRVFYNITMLMTMFSLCNYFATVLPGAVGANRRDRVRKYLHRSIATTTALMVPLLVLQLFSAQVMAAAGVPIEISLRKSASTRALMVPVGYLMMIDIHAEIIFVNLGFVRCAALNSLVTGCGIDILCTYIFVFRFQWGMTGIALSQCIVKASRLLVWFVLAWWFRLGHYFCGSCARLSLRSQQNPVNSAGSLAFSLLGPAKEDPLFSWSEFRVYLECACCQLCLHFFTGWLIFELQIICLAHIDGGGIPKSALAAGSVWVQTESTLAAVQSGFLQVTKMRTLNLMGKNDVERAKKSYAALCIMCFLLVAITNIPLYFGRNAVGYLLSNDLDVREWFGKIAWVLVVHTQTRICSINAGALLIPIKKGCLAVSRASSVFTSSQLP